MAMESELNKSKKTGKGTVVNREKKRDTTVNSEREGGKSKQEIDRDCEGSVNKYLLRPHSSE